jgi:hypothetical protein
MLLTVTGGRMQPGARMNRSWEGLDSKNWRVWRINYVPSGENRLNSSRLGYRHVLRGDSSSTRLNQPGWRTCWSLMKEITEIKFVVWIDLGYRSGRSSIRSKVRRILQVVIWKSGEQHVVITYKRKNIWTGGTAYRWSSNNTYKKKNI